MLKKVLIGSVVLVPTIALIAIILSIYPQKISNVSISGFHLRSENWSGTIIIKSDTLFVPWVTLTIEPGTKVLFEKLPDIEGTPWTKFADAYITDHDDPTGREGYNQSHFDLVARIKAVGTKENPIIFSSAQTKPKYADWDQLVIFGGSILDFVELSYSHNGVAATSEGWPFDLGQKVTITNSKIHDSLWSCIDIWSKSANISNNEVYHCWHQAIGVKKQSQTSIENNYLHDAQLSVNCEQGANPSISNNRFVAAPLNPDCPPGVDNQDLGRPADTEGGTYNGKLVYPSN